MCITVNIDNVTVCLAEATETDGVEELHPNLHRCVEILELIDNPPPEWLPVMKLPDKGFSQIINHEYNEVVAAEAGRANNTVSYDAYIMELKHLAAATLRALFAMTCDSK